MNLTLVSVDVGDIRLRCSGVRNCQIVSRDPEQLGQSVIRAIKFGRENGGRMDKRHEIDNEVICREVIDLYKDVQKRRDSGAK